MVDLRVSVEFVLNVVFQRCFQALGWCMYARVSTACLYRKRTPATRLDAILDQTQRREPSIDHDGVRRCWFTHVPASAASKSMVPLVVAPRFQWISDGPKFCGLRGTSGTTRDTKQLTVWAGRAERGILGGSRTQLSTRTSLS